MQVRVVRVPHALLFDRRLDRTAKFVWMVCRLLGGPPLPRTGLVQAEAGLARHTVLRALARLRAAGWLPPGPPMAATGARLAGEPAAVPGTASGPPAPAGVPVPADLMLDRRLTIQARVLYAILHSIAGPNQVQGRCTLADLSQKAGVSPNTVRRALRALAAAGWLDLPQGNKFSTVEFVLSNPAARQRDEAVARVARRLKAARFRGEALMREYLTLIVDSDQYDDDASPAFLVNPFTGEEMQFDRYYPPHVAVEFNGPQHYGPTEQYPDATEALKQQARDYIKQLICADRGIHLIIVHPEDLTLERMQEKVREHLPLRDLAGHEAVAAYLERMSRAYRRQVQEGRAAAAESPAPAAPDRAGPRPPSTAGHAPAGRRGRAGAPSGARRA